MTIAAATASAVLLYVLFVGTQIGLPRRLWLALRPLSIESIPDRAARSYGHRILFSSELPCAWRVPQLGDEPKREWSARDVQHTAAYLAGMFRQRLALGHGDRVGILKQNHLDIHLLHAGVVRAGGVACPMNGAFVAAKVAPYLDNVDARILVTDVPTLGRLVSESAGFGPVADIVVTGDVDELDPVAAGVLRSRGIGVHGIEGLLAGVTPEAPVARGAAEPLYLAHSSGTTGFPKAVILRNGPQCRAIRAWLCYVHVSRRDRGLLAVPNNHQAVILSFNSLLLAGIRVHWLEACSRDGVDPQRIVQQLAAGRYTGFFAFPIVYTQLKEVDLRSFDLRAMRFWASTADAAHEAVIRRFIGHGGVLRQLGIPVTGSVYLDAQGSTEVGTPSVIRYYSRFTQRYGRRIGRRHSAPFGPKIRIALDGTPVRRGHVGRLEVRGKTLFEAYWNNHTLTYAAFRDGWFFTGDVARFSKDGHVVQLDREVDVIRRVSGPVFTLPIEEKIHHHPDVFDACVFAARQADGTQAPAAAVAVRPGHEIDAELLRRQLNERLEPEEELVDLEVLHWRDFPIGVTGKTLKRVFRERTEPGPVTEANQPIVLRDSAGVAQLDRMFVSAAQEVS